MADSRRHLTLDEVVETIRANSIPEPNSGCLLWEGGLHLQPASKIPRHGVLQLYGYIRLRGKMTNVHRVMFEATHGCIPDGMQILHRCDVPLCCNPDHLFMGTRNDNHADKAMKDRGRKKLTHAKAVEIHKMRAAGMRQREIGRAMSVDVTTISRILSGKRRPAAMPAIS